jgi:hypothetical protein
MMELYNFKFDENTKTFSGHLRPFDGVPLAYYKMATTSTKKYLRRGTGSVDYAAIKQIHFILKDDSVSFTNEIRFSVNEIDHVELSEGAGEVNLFIGLGIVVGVLIAFTIFLAIACACPHVYVDDGSGLQLSNSLFTGAKAPQLERNDYKMLPDYHKGSAELSLNIVNEENENQYTNLVELWVVNHAKNLQVVPDKTGALHTIEKPISPTQALNNSATSILEEVLAADDFAYGFDADSLVDLSDVVLTFGNAENLANAKLLVRVKNSKWSGYVYNEFNALFGKNHDKWVERNKDKPKEEREEWMRDQGIKLLVEMKTAEGWQFVDEVELVGEISFNSVVVPLALDASKSNVEIRLRSGYKFWDLDYAALDYSEDQKLDVQVLKPVSAVDQDGQDYLQALVENDDQYMATSGDKSSVQVTFNHLKTTPEFERTLILRGKGYYVSQEQYTGKTQRKELKKFKSPGELSRYSKSLYDEVASKMAVKN